MGRAIIFLLGALPIILGPPVQAGEYVIMTEDCPPWGYVENGKLTGLSVEIVREILKIVKHPDNIKVYPWARAYDNILRKPNRILFSMGKSPEREPLFKWVGPIISNRCYFFKKRGAPVNIKSVEDAKSVKLISITRDFMEHRFLESKGFTNLDLTSKPELNVKKLVAGRVELITSGEIDLPYIAGNAGIDSKLIEQTNVMIYDSKLYIAFSMDFSDSEVEKWKEALDHVRRSGKYTEIRKRYISSN